MKAHRQKDFRIQKGLKQNKDMPTIIVYNNNGQVTKKHKERAANHQTTVRFR